LIAATLCRTASRTAFFQLAGLRLPQILAICLGTVIDPLRHIEDDPLALVLGAAECAQLGSRLGHCGGESDDA